MILNTNNILFHLQWQFLCKQKWQIDSHYWVVCPNWGGLPASRLDEVCHGRDGVAFNLTAVFFFPTQRKSLMLHSIAERSILRVQYNLLAYTCFEHSYGRVMACMWVCVYVVSGERVQKYSYLYLSHTNMTHKYIRQKKTCNCWK